MFGARAIYLIYFIKKFLNSDKLIKVYLPKLPEYKWEVNKDIIKKGILFNQYFIS